VTEQIIDINHIFGLRKGNVVIVDDYLCVWAFEKDEFYLNKYLIFDKGKS